MIVWVGPALRCRTGDNANLGQLSDPELYETQLYAMRSKPVKNVPLWPGHQFIPSGSCFELLPDLPRQWTISCKMKWTLFSPGCFWSWCFITAIEILRHYYPLTILSRSQNLKAMNNRPQRLFTGKNICWASFTSQVQNPRAQVKARCGSMGL